VAARKFPRDRRQWFRVLGDILHDPKIAKLTGDEHRLFVNLMAALCQSGSRDGVIRLAPRTLCALACRSQVRHAEPLLARLDAVGLTTTSRLGADSEPTTSRLGVDYLTALPNWPKLQGFDCTNRAEQSKEEEREREPAAAPLPAPIWGDTFDNPPEGKVTGSGKTVVTSVKPPALSQSDSTPKKSKRGTRCPEDLTPEQRAKVRAWRDRKHPEFDDWILKSEWEKCAAHYGALGTLRPDWVKSFYGWLLKRKDFNQAKGGADPPRPQPRAVVRQTAPPPDDPQLIAEIMDEFREGMKKRKPEGLPRNRRARQPEAPEASPPKEEDESA
jgi:hypothetical protein